MIKAAAPRVTVAMSMHNAAPFLRECIDSVLAQSFADFEFLIVDDGSTDSSATIAASYTDPRLCIISRPHGFIESLNTLLSHARGEYIARMDADDIMLPHPASELGCALTHFNEKKCNDYRRSGVFCLTGSQSGAKS